MPNPNPNPNSKLNLEPQSVKDLTGTECPQNHNTVPTSIAKALTHTNTNTRGLM